MAVFAFTDAFCHVAEYDFTGDSNELRLACEGEPLDSTTFASGGWREFALGLKTSTLDLAGFWQSATSAAVDPQIFPNLGTGRVITLGSVQTEGQPAFMLQSMPVNYQFGGTIGQLAPFQVTGACTDGVGVVRGRLMKEKGNISSTGVTGSVVQVGAVSATQYLYCTVHTFSIGTSFTLQIQSDNDSGFPSATTQMTTSSITAVGGTWVTRVAGPITDDYWRVNVSAVSGTSQIAVAVGIQ